MKPKPTKRPTMDDDSRRVILAAKAMANRMEPREAQSLDRAIARVEQFFRGVRQVFPTAKH